MPEPLTNRWQLLRGVRPRSESEPNLVGFGWRPPHCTEHHQRAGRWEKRRLGGAARQSPVCVRRVCQRDRGRLRSLLCKAGMAVHLMRLK